MRCHLKIATQFFLEGGIICRYKATKPVTSTSKFVIDMYLCQHPLLLYNQMNFLGWFAWYAADYLSGEAKQYFKGDGGGGWVGSCDDKNK